MIAILVKRPCILSRYSTLICVLINRIEIATTLVDRQFDCPAGPLIGAKLPQKWLFVQGCLVEELMDALVVTDCYILDSSGLMGTGLGQLVDFVVEVLVTLDRVFIASDHVGSASTWETVLGERFEATVTRMRDRATWLWSVKCACLSWLAVEHLKYVLIG